MPPTYEQLAHVLSCVHTTTEVLEREVVTVGTIDKLMAVKNWLETVRKSVLEQIDALAPTRAAQQPAPSSAPIEETKTDAPQA